MAKTFELLPEHITLIRNSYVSRSLSEVEYGAAEIDGKRPYGNSDVERDIAELLDVPLTEDGEFQSDTARLYCQTLHAQTPTALAVVLASGSFEPGLYERSSDYSRDWRLVGEAF